MASVSKRKVLITAIDSFTGKHLSNFLEQHGYDVYGTSQFFESEKTFRCDLGEKDDISGVLQALSPDYLIHLAGISFVGHAQNDEFYKVNTIGTINILDALVRHGLSPEKVILASSATVYGSQTTEVLDEGMCPKPANHYGASKHAMESLASNYFDRLNILITRPFNYTGTGQSKDFLIPKIIYHFLNCEPVIQLGNLEVSREFNDIGFVCEVYKRLMECSTRSEIVNIASGRAVKLLDIVDLVGDLTGHTIEINVDPRLVRANEIQTLTGSSTKLFSLIGEVEQKELRATLEEMLHG